MNRKWWKLIYMLPITFCTLYAGGYVAQFIRNYQTWESAGNFAGNGTAPQIPSPHPLACLDALTAFRQSFRLFSCHDDFPVQSVWDFSMSGSFWTPDLPSHAYGI